MNPFEFEFKLHPSQWEFEGDDIQIFKAMELPSGNVLIRWVNEKGQTRKVIHTKAEVAENLLNGLWVIQEN